MENRLDFIEKVLKGFFEQLSEADNEWMRQLMQCIVQALSLHTIPQEDGYSLLPEMVRVYVSPEDEKRIPDVQQFIQISKKDLLAQLATDHLISRNELSFTITSSQDVAKHQIKVVAIPVASNLEDTAVLTGFLPTGGKNPQRSKAYLLFPDGRDFPLDDMIINIGRNPENNLVLDFPMVSRHQAQIRQISGVHHLFDVQSTSGTYINEVMIEHGILNSGDVIRFADQQVIYVSEVSQAIQNSSIGDFDTQEIIQ